MQGMQFLAPDFLWLLLAVPGLVLAYRWLLRRKKKLALRYASLAIVKDAMAAGMPWRRHLPPALMLLAIALALLATARPLAVITLPSANATIILAIDVSLSMRVNDVKPNRMVAAQEAAKTFLQELPRTVKVGIVTFAGTAQVVQAPTLSREDLVAAIDRFQMQRSTAVGSAIVMSLATLFPDEGIDLSAMLYGNAPRGKSLDEQGKPAKKEFVPVPPGSYQSAAIILLTDGRRTTGVETEEAAKMAADHGVRVYAVGLGTVDGTIPGYEGWNSIYLKLDEPSLRAVAQTTKGEYYYAGDADALKKVYEKLSSRVQVESKETELSGLLALLAAALSITAGALSLAWFSRIV
jgi:Ca-activated chloride channel family protein